ncbi:hypothetical protein E5288_WYG007926 [Bos mutus]|uniref:Platelet-derived growth factor C n=1 Tax=Bos mutus TaxID=72004 RepID=A0A6B0QY67_9CETA|nr:hypothetical protein [Bos mutus]
MLLFGLLLLTSALAGQRPGTRAESNLSSKLQLASNKEQNGVQDPQHERIITVSTNGSVHSPRFPHTYPRNMDLVWRLVAVEENVWIQLTFDERFGLEDPEDDICKYDFVEVEEPSDGTILGRWCGSGSVPGKQISKGNQIRIRFVSDEYFPSEPGFCIHYNIVMPQLTETVSPSSLPASALPLDLLNNAVTAFSTLEDLIRYLEPDRWQLDLEDLYRPTSLQLLGKNFVFGRKSRVVDLNLLKEEVRLYSCTPRNFSVSVREELKRTDTIFWPGCLLVKRCGGNCACCLHTCSECQCVPSKVTKKYHEAWVDEDGVERGQLCGDCILVVADVYSLGGVCVYQHVVFAVACYNLQDGSIIPVTGAICWYRQFAVFAAITMRRVCPSEHSGLLLLF